MISYINIMIFFYFNNLINLIYFQVLLNLFKKHSTSFKDVQVFFWKDLKSNFFFGGFGFGGLWGGGFKGAGGLGGDTGLGDGSRHFGGGTGLGGVPL